jgi:hypothetical protein
MSRIMESSPEISVHYVNVCAVTPSFAVSRLKLSARAFLYVTRNILLLVCVNILGIDENLGSTEPPGGQGPSMSVALDMHKKRGFPI